MKIPPTLRIFAVFLSFTALTSLVGAQTIYDAYTDFYLSPTAAGWGGATSPSVKGATWGYYAANVNGYGFPTEIGTYFTSQFSGSGSQNLYQYSSAAPIGLGTFVGNPLWTDTGGAGFPRYADSQSWGSSLGRYDNPWFEGAPGWSQGSSNFIWMQPGYLGNAAEAPDGPAEGIASVLVWKAPQAGFYTFSGQFVAGNQPGNGASVAVVDSLGQTRLARTVLEPDTTQAIDFTASYATGDVVQFQVGSDFKTGNAVGLQISVVAPTVVTTNVILTLQTSTNLANPWQAMPVTAGMITPAGELNVGSLTNTNTFYRLKIRTAVQ